MSSEEPTCPECRLNQGKLTLLQAEVVALRNSVLALTSEATESTPVLEIIGLHQPQRLALAGPMVDGSDRFCRVSLTYGEQLSVRCDVPMNDPARFLRFFEDLAQHTSGWEGEKKVASAEDQLTITCRYLGKLYRPEVSMDVSCAVDYPSFDPYWVVQLRLDVDPESLRALATQARAVFANSIAAPCTAAKDRHDSGLP